jgi:hypothetical protein
MGNKALFKEIGEQYEYQTEKLSRRAQQLGKPGHRRWQRSAGGTVGEAQAAHKAEAETNTGNNSIGKLVRGKGRLA